MCPMIKEGDPPISYDLLEEARSNLDRDYGFALGEEDGRTVLFVRAPESKPDPFHSLEVVSFGVSRDDLAGVKDVFLVGDDRVVRVEPSTLRDLVQERLEEDPEVAKHLRNRLDRGYDYTVFRHKGARDHLRLGVRVPRERVDSLADEDREHLVEALSPILSSAKGRKIRAFYLVGDEHARRLSTDDLVDLVGPALEQAVESRPEPDDAPQETPEMETEPPSGADKMAPSGGSTGGTSGGTAPPGQAGGDGAEILGAEGGQGGSQASSGSGEPASSGGTSQGQVPPGATTSPEGPGSTVSAESTPGQSMAPGEGGLPDEGPGSPSADVDPDETGAEFLGSGPSEDTSSGSGGQASPDQAPDEAPATQTPSQGASPDPSDGKGAGQPSSSGASSETGSSGSADRPSPDDGGVAGLAGRAGQVDRPEPGDDQPEPQASEPTETPSEPAEAGGAGEPDDDIVTVEVDQAPDAEAPAPDTPEGAGDAPGGPAGGAGQAGQAADPGPDPEAPPQGGSAGSGEAPTPQGAAGRNGSAAEVQADPAPAAAERLRQAGYEVVEGVEAGGQPFDFAADRSGGKRLLGVAVETLGREAVEALVAAGREAGADAVLAIPLETEAGAREASWGTVVDLVPPEAAASLEL